MVAVIRTVGLHIDFQIAVIEVERRQQVEIEPAGMIEKYSLVQNQCGSQNLILPIHRVGGGVLTGICGLHVNPHRHAGCGSSRLGGLHTQRKRGDLTVTDLIRQIDYAATGIPSREVQGVRIGRCSRSHYHIAV